VTKHTDAGHVPKSKAASVVNASSQSKKAKRPKDAAGEERRTLLASNEVSRATDRIERCNSTKSAGRGGHSVCGRARSCASREGMKMWTALVGFHDRALAAVQRVAIPAALIIAGVAFALLAEDRL
jgi:hypothetical protein